MISTLLSLKMGCITSLDPQWVGVGVSGISGVPASWEATLPTPGVTRVIYHHHGVSASMVVYRCQEAPISRLTREKDVFFLGAGFDIPGAKLFSMCVCSYNSGRYNQSIYFPYSAFASTGLRTRQAPERSFMLATVAIR